MKKDYTSKHTISLHEKVVVVFSAMILSVNGETETVNDAPSHQTLSVSDRV